MVVVGVDGSDSSKEALRIGLYEAELRGARLRVVHAWLPTSPAPMEGQSMFGPVDPLAFEVLGPMASREAAETVLASTVEAVIGEKAKDVERVLVENTAADAILEQAHDAELIVVGQHGHGRISAIVLGSVSHHVIQHAHCPVLVVPADHG
jgi:nucleotide-binding universal stress UspA family protein